MGKPFFSVLALILATTASAQSEENYWQQFVHYTMDVTLIPEQHALRGTETIEYHNHSPDTLYQFYLHLYPNAYRNSETIRAQEAREYYQTLLAAPEHAGYIDITSFRILRDDGRDEETPVPAYEVKDTILEADLPTPLPPGGTMKIELSFYHKIRKHRGRAGYRGTQYDFAQWYPKVVVYDESGWNVEPFHLLGEFYGEFGTFDVTITTPYEYIIGATGEVVDGDPGWQEVAVDTSWSHETLVGIYRQRYAERMQSARNGRMRQVTFHAEKVHDFAWVASPNFLYEHGEWDGIDIHVLYRTYVKDRWTKAVLRRSVRGLEWLSSKFGRYPYPQVTVAHGLLRGGMEYPMLVMNARESESLILHEFGHIYFFGILANNEWKEAWLDEGFTTFQTRWYMETRYGKWGFDYDQWRRDANWLQRQRPRKTEREEARDKALAYMNSGHNEPISRVAFKYKDTVGYRTNAYIKGSFFYDMLQHVVGDSAFEAICHEYIERWKFKHVNEERFKRVCENVSGMELDWFFQQWLHDTVTVDYALGDVKKQRTETGWQTDVEILRKERGVMPVDVQLITQSGDTLIKRWDSFENAGKVTFNTAARPVQVTLDPEDAILDNSLFNNGPVGLEFSFEYPNLNYSPRDAYFITWRPSFWYNRVDKVRFGGRVIAREQTDRNLTLGLWFGSDSQVLDGRVRYERLIPVLGAQTTGAVMFQKMEGRLELDAHLDFIKRRNLSSPPQLKFQVGFNHSQLVGDDATRYTMRVLDRKNDTTIQTWEDGIVNKLYFRLSTNARGMNWFSKMMFGIETVQRDWRSDFTYSKAYTELKFAVPKANEGLFLRFYAETIGNEAPVQDRVFLDGANPRQRFDRFYLRSDGANPDWFHYHLPGGGNLRGYYNQPLIDSEILAFNGELRKQINNRIVDRFMRSVLGKKSVVLFFDAATVDILNVDILSNAGVGVRFQNKLPDRWYTIFTGGQDITLRLDFPLWVSDPLPDENSVRFRWVFGFEQAF